MKPLARTGWTIATPATAAEIDACREELRALGFRPAFFDYATCALHASLHRDGTEANAHVLDGLPDEAVVVRADDGRVVAAKATVLRGFERGGYFYTHAAAWRLARECGVPAH